MSEPTERAEYEARSLSEPHWTRRQAEAIQSMLVVDYEPIDLFDREPEERGDR